MNSTPVMVVEDDPSLRASLVDALEAAGHTVVAHEGVQPALAWLEKHQPSLLITDVQLNDGNGHDLLLEAKRRYMSLPVILITAYGTVERAVSALQAGAADYITKPFAARDLVALVARHAIAPLADGEFVAVDAGSKRVLHLAERVAQSDSTVLMSGESGTGKEVLAQTIHRWSSRARGPFVAINCAAIPENMLEAVLFGYEKGAFTGATSAHQGKFEQAQGGTLLLDEISEMDLGLQAKLLRVLQEREVERLGGRTTIQLDVRVLATTNRNLREEVAHGRFREDLYYRLAVFPLTIPPLRERSADLLPLTQALLQRHCAGRRVVPTLSDDAVALLARHRWPGNVRELDNLLQRALILSHDDTLTAADLDFEALADYAPAPVDDELSTALADREQRLIVDALKRENGSRKAAAERLGISPRTLRYKLARLRDSGVLVEAI